MDSFDGLRGSLIVVSFGRSVCIIGSFVFTTAARSVHDLEKRRMTPPKVKDVKPRSGNKYKNNINYVISVSISSFFRCVRANGMAFLLSFSFL